jgi:23S rRNA pseudouridine1911/1915/1917 synthase
VSQPGKYIDDPSGAPQPESDDEADPLDDCLVAVDVGEAQHGWRLDRALAALCPEHSRSRLQQWITAGRVSITPARSAAPKPRDPVLAGDRIVVVAAAAPQELAFVPEPMPLAIVHEDASLIVLDKPSGLVVHPAPGHWSGTLLNGLLAHDAALLALPRAGIVHRLDADTSGLMVVARTLQAQTDLVRQLQARSITREYWAVVHGICPEQGTIDAPLGLGTRGQDALPACGRARARWAVIFLGRLPTRYGANPPDPCSHGTPRSSASRRPGLSARPSRRRCGGRRTAAGLGSVRSAGVARVPAGAEPSSQRCAVRVVPCAARGHASVDAATRIRSYRQATQSLVNR